jgi:hypothetical protein
MVPIITDTNEAYALLKAFRIHSLSGRRAVPKDGFTLNDTGLSLINSHFGLESRPDAGISHIPIKFADMNGSFTLNKGILESLDGCPGIVGSFFLFENNVKTLVGGPHDVEGAYCVRDNPLTTLEGITKSCRDLSMDYRPIPMLRLLVINYAATRHYIKIAGIHHSFTDIFLEYTDKIKNGESIKKVMWECQQKLIGFKMGHLDYSVNAAW